MRRGFTLVEILTCVAILLIVFAISLPAFRAAKESAKRADTIESLRQLGHAFALYRADYETDPNASDPESLGFPPDDNAEAYRPFTIFGQKYKNAFGRTVRVWYGMSRRTSTDTDVATWTRYVQRCGPASVIVGDFTFNDFDPIKSPTRSIYGIGLRLDGGVVTQTHPGAVPDPFWWECKP